MEQAEETNEWCAVVVASGQGSNYINEFQSEESNLFSSLVQTPIPLLPFADIPLLDHWLQSFIAAGIQHIFVLSNNLNHSSILEWALTRGLSSSQILNCCTDVSKPISSINLGLHLQQEVSEIMKMNLLLVSCDSLLHSGFNLRNFLSGLPVHAGGVVYDGSSILCDDYKPCNTEILESTGEVVAQLDRSIEVPAKKIFPHLYAFRKDVIPHIFQHEFTDLQLLMQSLILEKTATMFATAVDGIFSVGTLEGFKAASIHYSALLTTRLSSLPRSVTQFCPARVGLMGNPSDGFGGRTLSFLIKNFNAAVTVTQNEPDSYGTRSRSVTLVPHPVLDPSSFGDMSQMQLHTINKGYYGGIRLLQATCKSFSEHCVRAGVFVHLQRGFSLTYDTDIPRMVGLSGSSAIVVAAFKALMQFYGVSLQDLNISKEVFPKVILDIELVELGIACGLQDRVVQSYGGLVHMDFTGPENVYTEQDKTLLPPMYLTYNMNAGGESGKVHSTVKVRWQQKDPALLAGMQALGDLPNLAVESLRTQNWPLLAELMEKNFALRRELYGDGPVGALNIEMVELASSLGMAAKFTGSGGALLCLQRNGQGWLSAAAELEAVEAFGKHGFRFSRVEIA